jgi:DNA-binding beta-propeller fold protein YncE
MMKKVLALCLLGCAPLAAQQIPAPTALPGDIFYIKQTWPVGGTGDNLSYMTLDPSRLQLFLAYRHSVTVEDVKSGTAAGKISGTNGGFGIALDNTGEFGYISDGKLNQIDVFDRRSLEVVGIIPTAFNPTAVIFEPASGLVFAVCRVPGSGEDGAAEMARNPWLRTRDPVSPSQTNTIRGEFGSRRPHARPLTEEERKKEESKSIITVIDADSWRAIGDIQLPYHVTMAQTAGDGQVYFVIPEQAEIARIDTEALRERLRREPPSNRESEDPTPKEMQLRAGRPLELRSDRLRDAVALVDWSDGRNVVEDGVNQVLFLSAGQCRRPQALAVDQRHLRLFVGCPDMKMAVLDADTGKLISSLPTGPGTDSLAFDPDHGLIYASNSGGNGTLTIIRQYVTDSYAVIQNLPTNPWARTLSVDPVTGIVYLVTLATESTTLERIAQPVNREQQDYQILVIGH